MCPAVDHCMRKLELLSVSESLPREPHCERLWVASGGAVQTLLTDIMPAAKVKQAMNEINAALRMREAAVQKAEANKITVVKAAEADAEAKFLAGEGAPAPLRPALLLSLPATPAVHRLSSGGASVPPSGGHSTAARDAVAC